MSLLMNTNKLTEEEAQFYEQQLKLIEEERQRKIEEELRQQELLRQEQLLKEQQEMEEKLQQMSEEEAAFHNWEEEMVQAIEEKKQILKEAVNQQLGQLEVDIEKDIREHEQVLQMERLRFEQHQQQLKRIQLEQFQADKEWEGLMETTKNMSSMDKLKVIAPNLHTAMMYAEQAQKKEVQALAIKTKMNKVQGKRKIFYITNFLF